MNQESCAGGVVTRASAPVPCRFVLQRLRALRRGLRRCTSGTTSGPSERNKIKKRHKVLHKELCDARLEPLFAHPTRLNTCHQLGKPFVKMLINHLSKVGRKSRITAGDGERRWLRRFPWPITMGPCLGEGTRARSCFTGEPREWCARIVENEPLIRQERWELGVPRDIRKRSDADPGIEIHRRSIFRLPSTYNRVVNPAHGGTMPIEHPKERGAWLPE